MDKGYSIQEAFIIQNLDALKVIADPTRLQIVRNLDKPRTVKELAGRLEIPATKLYYHVNQLEKHHIIQVVDRRIVSGIIEKHYQVTARRYHVSESLLQGSDASDEQVEALLSAIFDTAKEEVKQSVLAGLLQLPKPEKEPGRDGLIWRASMRLMPEKFAELNGRLQSVLDEFEAAAHAADKAGDTQDYGLMAASYPILNPQGRSDE